MQASQRASRACATCQKNKRRCDKVLPTCGVCSKLRKSCDYTNRQSENDLRLRIQELESSLASRESTQPSSSTDLYPVVSMSSFRHLNPPLLHFQMLFLDSDLQFQSNGVGGGTPCYSIPPIVMSELGNNTQMADIASRFFDSIHCWMTFISKVKWQRILQANDGTVLRSDYALLILSMKLIQAVPTNTLEALRSPLYTITREFSTALEMAGVYSLQRLQANLLVTAYEMGHGILPSAYTSLGSCVTLAIALGIHNEKAPQMLEKPRSWVEWEERLRTWWLVRILDRVITSGGDNRPLFTEEPTSDSHLPADDDAWNTGRSLSPERLFISSPNSISTSPFSRIAQAAYVLGQVIRHCNELSNDLPAVYDRIERLSSIIDSLLALLMRDEQSMAQFCNAISLCFSAMMKLYDNHSCDGFAPQSGNITDMDSLTLLRVITEKCRQGLTDTTTRIISFNKSIGFLLGDQELQPKCDSIAPWSLHCVYRASAAVTWMGQAAPLEEDEVCHTKTLACVNILQKGNERWKIGESYLEARAKVERDLESGDY